MNNKLFLIFLLLLVVSSFSVTALCSDKTLVIADSSLAVNLEYDFSGSTQTATAISLLYDGLMDWKIVYNEEYGVYEAAYTLADPGVDFENELTEDGLRVVDWDSPDTALRPALCERLEISPDWKIWRFHLRKGVFSPYGNELTSEDVRFTWERNFYMHGYAEYKNSAASFYGMDQVKVLDKYIIQLTLPESNYQLLYNRTETGGITSICDSTEVKKHITDDDPYAAKWILRNAAGFGPYTLKEWTSGNQMIFSRREDYYREIPYFENVIIKEVPDSSNRLALIMGGAVDIARDLSPKERETATESGVRVLWHPGSLQTAIICNTTIEPFDDVLVRKAMAYITPYDEIMETVYMGQATRLGGPVNDMFPGSTNYAVDMYSYNPEKAKELLDEAGYPNGFNTTLYYDLSQPYSEDIAILLQSSAKNVGINLTLEKIPSSNFLNRLTGTKDMPIFINERDMPWEPGVQFSVGLYHIKGAFGNFSMYYNPEVDQLWTDIKKEEDIQKKLKMEDELQRIIVNDVSWIFLAQQGWHVAIGDDIQGIAMYGDNAIRPQFAWRE
jgi:peptide/nickel transport system substrate-binding protein